MNTTGITSQSLLDNSANKAEKKSNAKKSSKGDFSELLGSAEKKDKKSTINKNDRFRTTSTADTHSKNYDKKETLNEKNVDYKAQQPQDENKSLKNNVKNEKVVKKQDPVINKLKTESSQVVNSHIANKLNEVEAENNPTSELSQRLAMQNFLLKMKKELDVHPQQLIEAFGTMSTEELLSPPEDSVGQLLASLDLNPEQNQKAELYFHEMLKQTASSSMADYMKENNSDLSIEVLSKKELQNNRMQKAITDMSSHFFVNGKDQQGQLAKGAMVTAGVVGANEALNQTAQNAALEKNAFFDTSGQKIGAESVSGTDAGLDISQMQAVGKEEASNLSQLLNKDVLSQGPNSLTGNQANQAQAATESLSEIASSTDLASQADVAEGSGFLENLNLGLTANGNSTKESMSESAGQGVDSSMGAENNDILGLSVKENSTASDGQLADGESSENPDMMHSQVKVDSGNQAQQKEFMINTKPQATEVEESANVKEVVNQARLMVKKGGGEMKVQMTPHGLGEVTMKVNVENGNVNVEMLADTADAKKILEKGISELKATLASHKLNVENIKVDTSSNLMGDMTEKQDEAERQFAQQFMGEFRRDNQSWRNGFYGMTGARAYSSQTQDEAENPLLTVNNNKRSRVERRLDLVA